MNLKNKNYFIVFLAYIPFIFLCSIIFLLSSQSKLPGILPINHIDKVWHLIAYFFVGLSLIVAVTVRKKNINVAGFLESWFIASLYGLLDEIHQLFVPGRIFSFLDLFADMLGAALGIMLFSYMHSFFRGIIKTYLSIDIK